MFAIKRVFSSILAAVMLFSLSSCGGIESPPTDSGASGKPAKSQSNGNIAEIKNVESNVDITQPILQQQEAICLWNEGNMPTITEYPKNTNSEYFDPPDFRPNMVCVPAKQGVKVKGAILLCAGGAFQFRGNEYDCFLSRSN